MNSPRISEVNVPPSPARSARTAPSLSISALGLLARYRRAALNLFLERALGPALMPLAITALFVAISWSGLFAHLGPTMRMIITLLAITVILLSAVPLLQIKLPQSDEIMRWLDRSRPDAHRPLATLNDTPAASDDPLTRAIWNQHQMRAQDEARRLDALQGDAKLRVRDPYAFRLIAVLALVASAFIAGDERSARLASAFDWTTPSVPPVPPRLDAWIDPPAYTGRPPIFLTGAVIVQPGEVIRAPVGSILTVRSTSIALGAETKTPELRLEHGSGFDEPAMASPDATADKSLANPVEKAGVATAKRIVRADGDIRVMRNGREIAAFRIGMIPDLPPSVTLSEVKQETTAPDRQSPAGIRLTFDMQDDYGVAKAEAVIEQIRPQGAPAGRTLYPAPVATLPLRLGPGEAAIATEDHPWAGVEVNVFIKVEDDLGQSAKSEVQTVTLPRRAFTQPLAKALVEQRRNLVFAPDQKSAVLLAFEGLLFDPERFTPNIGEFLALDSLRAGLRNARSDDRLREMSERIYEYALHLENGDMSDAERRLREAEARLRDGLEREAPANEIRKLAEDLRRAMDEFIRELAERSLRDRDQNAQDRNSNTPERMISQRDLQDMLRKIEEMARSGNMAEAQRLMQELREILEQLRSARRQDIDPKMREMGRQIEELDKLQREQRDLRDRTFRKNQQRGQPQGQQGQRQQGQRQPGQRGQQQEGDGDESEESLQQQQEALEERLKQLRERLKQRGMQEGEGFGEAEEGMGDAKGKLGQGKPGDATQGQQRALDGLGKAQQGMSDQLQQQMGQNPGEGEGEGEGMGQPGQTQRGRAENRSDPLGRPQPNARRDIEDNSRVKVPDADMRGVGERADRVLRELRKRLGEFERPREELDYLERLLRQR